MKKILLTLSILIFTLNGSAQEQKYPKGVYMNLDEITARTPSIQMELNVEKRSSGAIVMSGGNDYKVSTKRIFHQ